MSAHHQNACLALMRAGVRARELRDEAMGGRSTTNPTIFVGAPSHSAAHLLNALDEQGWAVVPADEVRK